MPVSDEFRDYVLEQLEGLGELRSKRMFGGVGIYCDDLFFALIAENVPYLKVDDSNRCDFETRGLRPFQPFPDRSTAMSYYPIPADVLEDHVELRRWACKSLEVARNATQARKR